ncbi:NAC domain-containing protein 96-like isoform X1 [Rhododendron vialii]|uniref:NAC domain-containing protein 96-like isoform X1 n=2 Tax=Rhododendron vialii TaxID=182163 RepID=UPI00265FEA42|nr:NAC domain-containing protein 96-like isoform X1 [Rhododendron vialii]
MHCRSRGNGTLPFSAIFGVHAMANPGLPIGYVFSPSGEDSMEYLKRKILNQVLPSDVIPTADVYSCADPRQIPLSEFKHGPNNEWQFFSTKREGNLIKTTNGHWEENGEEDEIEDGNGGSIGFVRILDFHYSNPKDAEKGEEWHIQEYRVSPAYFTADELVDDNVKEKISNFVLCKIVCEEQIPTPKPPTNSSSDDEE